MDKEQKVRDVRSDNQGEMLHMYSVLIGKSRTPAPALSHSGQISKLSQIPSTNFLPSCEDVSKMKANLVIIISRVFTQCIEGLTPFS